MDKKTVGILGGMGPLATVELFRLIVSNTESPNDQGHIRIIIDNNPQIPDRTNAILNGGESPVNALVKSASMLKNDGADFLIIPCNTSHYYIDEISRNAGIEIVNMIETTAIYLKEHNIKTIGLLATSGSVKTLVYEKTLSKFGISTLYPDENGQQEVMDYIYKGIKAGNINQSTEDLKKICEELIYKGASNIVLGCTELSIGYNTFPFKSICVDPMTLLARETIKKAGYSVINVD